MLDIPDMQEVGLSQEPAAGSPHDVPDFGWPTMTYHVNYGDTVARLSTKFDMTMSQLLQLNGLQEGHVLEVDSAILVREWSHDGKCQASPDSLSKIHANANLAVKLEEDEFELGLQSEEDKLAAALEAAETRVKELHQETIIASRDRSSTLTLETGEQVQNASRIFAEELMEDEDDSTTGWWWLCPCYKRYERLEMVDLQAESPAPSPVRIEIADSQP